MRRRLFASYIPGWPRRLRILTVVSLVIDCCIALFFLVGFLRQGNQPPGTVAQLVLDEQAGQIETAYLECLGTSIYSPHSGELYTADGAAVDTILERLGMLSLQPCSSHKAAHGGDLAILTLTGGEAPIRFFCYPETFSMEIAWQPAGGQYQSTHYQITDHSLTYDEIVALFPAEGQLA